MLLKVKTPRTIFRVAMVCLALFGGLGTPALSSMFSEDLLDGVRGALLGATIVLIYLTLRLQWKRREQCLVTRERRVHDTSPQPFSREHLCGPEQAT